MHNDIIDGIGEGRNLCVMDFDLKTYHDGRITPLENRVTALEESPSGGSSGVNQLVRMGWLCEENGDGFAPDATSWWTTWKHFGTVEQDFQLFKLYPEEFSLWEIDFEVLQEADSGVFDDKCVIRCNPWYSLTFDGYGRKKWRLQFGGGTFNFHDLNTGETVTAEAMEADTLSNPREMNVLEAAFSIGINSDYPSAHPKLRIYSVERVPYPHKDIVGGGDLPSNVITADNFVSTMTSKVSRHSDISVQDNGNGELALDIKSGGYLIKTIMDRLDLLEQSSGGGSRPYPRTEEVWLTLGGHFTFSNGFEQATSNPCTFIDYGQGIQEYHFVCNMEEEYQPIVTVFNDWDGTTCKLLSASVVPVGSNGGTPSIQYTTLPHNSTSQELFKIIPTGVGFGKVALSFKVFRTTK